jgi:hypothetical protein
MKRFFNAVTATGLALVMASVALVAGPVAAQSSRQKDKNNMRNLGVGLGAVAAHQALKGKTTNALVLGAGAAYAGKKYEDSRKAQRRENERRYSRSRRSSKSYARSSNGRKVGYYRNSRHSRP